MYISFNFQANPNACEKMFTEQNCDFHNYASTLKTVPIINDHSLQTDLRTLSSSPNSLSIYDQELPPTATCGAACDSFVNLDDFDLKPQMECSDLFKSLNGVDLFAEGQSRGDQAWSLDENIEQLLEDTSRTDQRTLAALNFPEIDDLGNIENVVLNPGGGQLMWSQGVEPIATPQAPTVKHNSLSILKTSNRQNNMTVAGSVPVTSAWSTTPVTNTTSSVQVINSPITQALNQPLLFIKQESKTDIKPSPTFLKALDNITPIELKNTTPATLTTSQPTSAKPVPIRIKEEPAPASCMDTINTEWQKIKHDSVSSDTTMTVIKSEPEGKLNYMLKFTLIFKFDNLEIITNLCLSI